MSAAPFDSPIGPVVMRFLALKRALGRGYAQEEAILRALDAFLAAAGPADLTVATFAAWGQTLLRLMPGVRRNWLRIARNLCLYRRRTEPTCFVPDPAGFPAPHQPVTPYIFAPQEVARLLQCADRLVPTPGSPLRAAVYRVAIVLLYTTGLRRGELLRLTVGDYDPIAQTLAIRASKYHKSRCLPLAADGAQEIERYLTARRARHRPIAPDLPLVWRGAGCLRPYTGEGFAQGFRALCRTAGIQTPAGRAPRVHDTRHSCAVQALLRWYHAGSDVQAKLPLLATYLGHVSIVSTAYYLHFLAPVALAASDRFAQRYGALIASLPGKEDAP
jgi:integrase/recombinase XerD